MISLSFMYVDVAIPRCRFRVIINPLFLSRHRDDCCITRVFSSRITTLRVASRVTFFSFIIMTPVISKN